MSLLSISRFTLCLILLIAAGCDEGPDAVTEEPVAVTPDAAKGQPPLMGDVVINDAGVAVDQWGRDRYEIETRGDDAPAIRDNTLTITMSYSGGCEDHDFTLVAADAFMESYPVQLAVSVAHDAHGDRCRAYLTETYGFNLTPVKTLYQEAYQEDAGTIVLRLQGAPENVPDLIYTFGS